MRKITAGKLNEDKEPLFREDTTAHILRFALPLLLPGSTFLQPLYGYSEFPVQ